MTLQQRVDKFRQENSRDPDVEEFMKLIEYRLSISELVQTLKEFYDAEDFQALVYEENPFLVLIPK